MNHIYSVLWNAALGDFCVTSEIGRSRATTQRRAGATSGRLRPSLATLAALVALAWAAPAWSQALPQSANLVHGDAVIKSAGQQMNITQTTPKAILDWQSFNIGAGHTVNFQQPNAASLTLNRVVGADPSAILGQLSANGQVFLVNPNGVLFGPDAQIDVGGLVASTLNLSNKQFLEGNYLFNGPGQYREGKGILNQGKITAADGGAVALLGGRVSNQGTIVAHMGTVALAAGDQIALDFAGDGVLHVNVNRSALNTLVENGELITADGGRVLMSALATDALAQTVVNNHGTIQARTVENRQGKIILLGGTDGGTVEVGGMLDVGADKAGDGGLVHTRGARHRVLPDTWVHARSNHGLDGTWQIETHNPHISAGDTDHSGIPAQALKTHLRHGNLVLKTLADGTQGDIHVDADVDWSLNRLTLDAHNSIHLNAALKATGTAALAMNHGAAANSGVKLAKDNDDGFIGRIDFTGKGNSNRLQINGSDYTIVTDMAQLQALDQRLDGKYALGADLNGKDMPRYWYGAKQKFTPIGATPEQPFTGELAGLGHKISDLSIHTTSASHVGLFGVLEGQVHDLGIEGGEVSAFVNKTTPIVDSTGREQNITLLEVGAIAGRVDGGSIHNVYTTAKVTGKATHGHLSGAPIVAMTGGVAGRFVKGQIDNVQVKAKVWGFAQSLAPDDAYSAVGGAVGHNEAGSLSHVGVQAHVVGHARSRTPTMGLSYLLPPPQSGLVTSYVGGAVGAHHGAALDTVTASGTQREASDNKGSQFIGSTYAASHALVGNSEQATRRVIEHQGKSGESPTSATARGLPQIAYTDLNGNFNRYVQDSPRTTEHLQQSPVPSSVDVFIKHGEGSRSESLNASKGGGNNFAMTKAPTQLQVVSNTTVPTQNESTQHIPLDTVETSQQSTTTLDSGFSKQADSSDEGAEPRSQVRREDPVATAGNQTSSQVNHNQYFTEQNMNEDAKRPPEGVEHSAQVTVNATTAPNAFTAASGLTNRADSNDEGAEARLEANKANTEQITDGGEKPLLDQPSSPAIFYPYFTELANGEGAAQPREVRSVADIATNKTLNANPVDTEQHKDSTDTSVVAETIATPSTASPVQAIADNHVVSQTAPRLADMAPLPSPAPAASVRHAEASPRTPVEQERLLRNPAYVGATASAATTATERIAPQPAVAPASEDAPYGVIGSAIRLPAR